MKKLLVATIGILFLTGPVLAQSYDSDAGMPWNSTTADRYNQQNQMQEDRYRQDEQMREQHEETERQQQQIQQERDQFNNMSPAERLTYGHL